MLYLPSPLIMLKCGNTRCFAVSPDGSVSIIGYDGKEVLLASANLGGLPIDASTHQDMLVALVYQSGRYVLQTVGPNGELSSPVPVDPTFVGALAVRGDDLYLCGVRCASLSLANINSPPKWSEFINGWADEVAPLPGRLLVATEGFLGYRIDVLDSSTGRKLSSIPLISKTLSSSFTSYKASFATANSIVQLRLQGNEVVKDCELPVGAKSVAYAGEKLLALSDRLYVFEGCAQKASVIVDAQAVAVGSPSYNPKLAFVASASGSVYAVSVP